VNNGTYAIHPGDTPTVTGDYNAGNDALLPGANSISTLSTADFANYAANDFRIDSGSSLVGAGSGGGDIGAFVQSSVTPVLSTPTPSGTLGTQTTATLGATTDTSSGTLYGVVDSAANISGITAAQIKAGNNNGDAAAVASSNSAVSTTSPTTAITGLTAGTLYSYAVVQTSGSDSNVLTGTFTTAAAGLTASITSITDPITTGGSATITGTGFDTTQGTGFVTQEGIAVTETGWSDTSVIITSLTVESTVTKYGTQTFLLENDDGNSDTITADVDPASGNSYVDLAGTLATSGDRITATGDLVASDQLRYQNVLWQSGSPTAYTVSVDATGLFTIGNGPVPAGEYTFEVRAWDSTAPGWGTAADQTVNVAAPGPVITGSASHNVAENSAFSYDYTVAPMLGELPTISGPDVLLFTWVAQGSDVYRLGMTAKNYESPTDANADNVYSVTITADDLVNTPVTLDVNVTVTNVIEQTIVDGGDLVVEVPYGETGLAKTDALFTNWLATYSNATSNTAGSLPDTLLISNGAYTVTFSLADANDIDGDFTVTEAAAIAPSLPATLERTVTNGNNSITFAAATGTPTITYVLGGTDAALFDLVGLTATLITGEFDESTKSSYALTLTASSAHGDDAVQTITVTVIEDYPRDAELTELGWLTFYPADAYPRATLTGSGWETNYPVNPHQEATLTEDGWEVDEIE
jgi:hypothetical protein